MNAASLTEAQREALVACVDALAELAGEGLCVAEEAIFNLFEVFGGHHTHANEEYGVWARDILQAKEPTMNANHAASLPPEQPAAPRIAG